MYYRRKGDVLLGRIAFYTMVALILCGTFLR